MLPECKFVLTEVNRAEFEELFFGQGDYWNTGLEKNTLGKTFLFFESGALLYTDSKVIFDLDPLVELTPKNPDANIIHPITGIEL